VLEQYLDLLEPQYQHHPTLPGFYRDRGVITPTEEDLEWLREKIDADQGKDRIQDIEQYQCYDCEDRYPGLPFYTMIPSTVQEYGAFLCQFCFKGLEKKGFVPDQADDPRQIF